MVSSETFINRTDCKIQFTIHTNDSDKQLDYVISQNNKLI